MSTAGSPPNEEELRNRLRGALRTLQRREPLEGTYKRLLMQNNQLAAPPRVHKEKFYRRVGSNLRARVERFLTQIEGKDPLDRIAQRQPLEEAPMRAALTLREAKEHEQQALLDATLASFPRVNGMEEVQRKRYFEGIALGLQSREKRPRLSRAIAHTTSAAEQTEQARKHAEWEAQREKARIAEEARRKREEDERKRREQEIERRRNHVETPQQGLYKIYHPIFMRLWEMEFKHLNGTNPFRMVIDRDNCAAMGAPDYFDIVEKPMNLTYIQAKVENMEYKLLSEFFEDCELMLSNAIRYNSSPENPYRLAAEEMKRKYEKIKKKVVQTIQQQQKQRK